MTTAQGFLQLLYAHARAGRRAVLSSDEDWSYADLLDRAFGFERLLNDAGVPPGRPVPALLSASPEGLAAVVGGCRSKRPLAVLSPRSTPDELRVCVQRLSPHVLVADPDAVALGTELASELGIELVTLDRVDPIARPPVPEDRSGRDVVALLHTSGTTGVPKRVDIVDERLARRMRANAALLGMTAASVYVTASPFHHIGGLGMIFVALGAGATVVPYPRFSVDSWQSLRKRQVTHGLLVPTMFHTLLEKDALAIETLELLQYGGAPMDPGLLERVLAALPDTRFVQIFGQTEGSPISCLTDADHARAAAGEHRLLRSVGRAAPGVELRIDQPDERGVGELWARAEHLFAAGPDGWLHTGDLGYLDPEGYLFLVGRKGDKIIRGGENVFPLEVERVLEKHPAVLEAGVVGVSDERLGERIRAHLLLRDASRPPEPAELHDHCRERLAGFKVPAEWVLVTELPRNSAGKLLRRELAKLAASDPRRIGDLA